MAKIPKGAKVVYEAPDKSNRVPLPKGAKVTYEGPSGEEAARMPVPEPSKFERFAEWLRGTPERVADSATSPKFAQSFAGGHTLGVTPYLSAAIDAAPVAMRKLAGNPGDVSGTYSRSLDRIKAGFEAADKAEPVAGFVGQATSPNLAGKGTAGARLLSAGANSAITAATHDGNALGDATLGAGVQGAAELAPGPLGRFGKMLRSASGTKAVQSMGTRAGITDRLAKMGVAPEDVPALGNRFMDEGLVPTGLNPFRAPIEAAAGRTAALKKSAGSRIEEAISKADASGASFDPSAAQSRMRDAMRISNPLEEANAGKAGKLIDQVGEMTPQGEFADADSFRQANRMKSQAWEGADFRTDPKLAPKLYRQAVGGFRDDIQRQVGEATSPEVAASLAAANHKYGTASKASDILGNAESRDLQKRPFGPLKHAVAASLGAGGLAASGGAAGVGGLVAPYLTEQIATRGPNILAHAYRRGSQATRAASKSVAQAPGAASAAARYIAEATGEEPKDKDDVARKYFLDGM